PALHADVAAVAPREPGDLVPALVRGLRELEEHLLALALYRGIDAEFLHRDARRRGGVWPDRAGHRLNAAERGQRLLRDAQLGRRAAPEQIARRRRHDDHVGREIP